jgi:DNA-binding NarL/FixJ family response regulator
MSRCAAEDWPSQGTMRIVERIGTLLNSQPAVDHGIEAESGRNIATSTNRSVGTTGDAAAILTAREEEVVRLIIVGASNKEIARLLDISVATVKSHVHNLLSKLGLTRRGKVALWYESSKDRVTSHGREASVIGIGPPPTVPVANVPLG